MLPLVKVSNDFLNEKEWAELQALAAAARDGAELSVPPDWAAAKGWLGPEVSLGGSSFTSLQKFFYGVYALRHLS